jgi:hypothetical protein
MNLIWNDNHIINIWKFRSPIPTINLFDINLCHYNKANVDKQLWDFKIDLLTIFVCLWGSFHLITIVTKFLIKFFFFWFLNFCVPPPPPPPTILLMDCHMDITTWLTWWNYKNDMLKFFVKQYFSNTNKIVLKYFLLLTFTCS